MQGITKFIYDALNDEDKTNNVFENTSEKCRAVTNFEKLYIDTIEDLNHNNTVWNDFLAAVMETRRVAFEIGLKAGIELMIESLGKGVSLL